MERPSEIRRSRSLAQAGEELLPLASSPLNWIAPTPASAPLLSQARLVGDLQIGCVVEVQPDQALVLRVSMKPTKRMSFPEMTQKLFAFLGGRRIARPPAKWECRWVAGGWCHFATVLRKGERGATA